MKNIFFIICLVVVITGCRKSNTPYNNLTGNWEMVNQMSMHNNEIFATGQGNLLQFNPGDKYKIFVNGLMINEGTYRLAKKGSTAFNKNFDAIFLGEDGIMNAISIKSDSLYISTPPTDDKGNLIMDGGSTIYIRQK
jgi:hypothetical protein